MILGTTMDSNPVINIVFFMLSLMTIIVAFGVIRSTNIFRAALFLMCSFITIACLLILLNAEFLAAIQIILNIGAVSVLILFSILLSKNVEKGNPSNQFKYQFLSLVVIIPIILIACISFIHTWIPDTTNSTTTIYPSSIVEMARTILQRYVLPFEIASILLLSAMIGALSLIRKR